MIIKKGIPEEGELIFCTVTKIFGHGVFVIMDEYNKPAMIHISEIAPGRIRNMREYVIEGKKLVCVVLRIHPDKGHVDLSLRRVNESQKRKKLEEIKVEQTAEKLIEVVAKQLKRDPAKVLQEVVPLITKDHPTLSSCFADVVNGQVSLKELGVEKEFAEKLTELITQKMKPPKAIISGKISLKSFEPDGVVIIRDALMKAQESAPEISIKYLGDGKYLLQVEAVTFKEAEKKLEKAAEIAMKPVEKKDGIVSFARD